MLIKWVADRVVALVGLIILAPLLLVVAVLARVRMPDGPVIFRQERVGRRGKSFTLYKFRTMVMHHQGAAISVGGEGRITPFGAKLRRYKLDELPQLWNVLIGDMSLVGPRPDVPSEIEKLTLEQKRILDVRPGITSPASLKYRNEERILQGKEDPLRYYDEVVLPDKIRMNLDYVDNWSLWRDVVCIVKTVL